MGSRSVDAYRIGKAIFYPHLLRDLRVPLKGGIKQNPSWFKLAL